MRPLLLAALALSLAACDSTGDPWPQGFEVDPTGAVAVADADDLARARAAWEAAEPDGYRLRYETVCFCAPTVVDVRVVGGQITELLVNGEAPIGAYVTPGTVDGLFEEAAFAFERGAASVQLAVLAEGALPVSLSIDWDEALADDEVSYVVRAFTPLEAASF